MASNPGGGTRGEYATTRPLNSRRLTAGIVNRIARGPGLPAGTSLEETRQLVEGKLGETREPRNVQVEVVGLPGGGTLVRLRDEGGVFMEIPADEESEETTEGLEQDGSENLVNGVEATTDRHNEMMSRRGHDAMPPSARCEDAGTHAQERLEQELEDARKQLETATAQTHAMEEELMKTHDSYRRTLEEKDQALERKGPFCALVNELNRQQAVAYSRTTPNSCGIKTVLRMNKHLQFFNSS